MTVRWTREAIEALGPTTTVPTAAEIVGVDAETVYGAIRRGEWDITRVLRIGRCIKIPTRDLVAVLYAPELDSAPQAGVPSPCQHPATPQATATEPHSQCGCRSTSEGVYRPLRAAP
ncbi:helix-turn-helix domain-containing protein [Streptomyces sp. S07_1.15]|uniref:helix-turn-helix domain-containing protein n=1 Tax=Streptomyces sp. S07_1.15 TaxID=2873925 RepID=UPI001D132D06|nr:helix-turn-helix domain-containing protein [Streptomyces sp. S07_1.15]MCC3652735.1 helix-turn-helix domain-containing protein [Streptomyces sp. S07_1.15]